MVMDPFELELQRVVSCPPGLIEAVLLCFAKAACALNC